MSFKVIKDGHGRAIGVEFRPTVKMLRLVVAVNRAENCHKSHDQLLKECRIKNCEWERWTNEYVIHEYGKDGEIAASKNYFLEWWENAIEIRSQEERELLRQVGLERALQGDHKFWIEMSKTYGAVSQGLQDTKRKSIPFNLANDATPDQIAEARQKLLESQRALGDGGGTGLARLTARRPKGAAS